MFDAETDLFLSQINPETVHNTQHSHSGIIPETQFSQRTATNNNFVINTANANGGNHFFRAPDPPANRFINGNTGKTIVYQDVVKAAQNPSTMTFTVRDCSLANSTKNLQPRNTTDLPSTSSYRPGQIRPLLPNAQHPPMQRSPSSSTAALAQQWSHQQSSPTKRQLLPTEQHQKPQLSSGENLMEKIDTLSGKELANYANWLRHQ